MVQLVSIYSDLLRYALAEQVRDDTGDEPVEELVAKLAEHRGRIGRGEGPPGGGPSNSPDRMASFVAHDVALVRLCERLSIEQMLTDPWASPLERDRLLSVLADRGIDLGEVGPRKP
jgi:hypothetical protein